MIGIKILVYVLLLLFILYYWNNIFGSFILLGKETFDVDQDMQLHINEINQFREQHAIGLEQDLFYYPYNDIYDKYKSSLYKNICQKKNDIDYKNEINRKNIEKLEKEYNSLKKQIAYNFNPVFDVLQLNKYETDENDKVQYLKLRKLNKLGNAKYQIYMNKDGTQCLANNDYNLYTIKDCDKGDVEQHFNINYVYDKSSYEDIVKNPKFRVPNNPDILNYPISVLRSKNGNCVNLHKDNISIEPCKYKTSQMFKLNIV